MLHLRLFLVALSLLAPLASTAQITFTFNYTDANTGFNDPAQGASRRTALETAAQLLAAQLPVTNPIVLTFDVSSNASNDDTLASASSASVGQDVGFSHTVVGQKIIDGTDANGGAADGEVVWNFFHNWDLDDSIAPDAFDFISTAMHELLHAVGFVSAIDSGGNGLFEVNVGAPNAWYAFDQFLVTASGIPFIDAQYRFNTANVSVLDDDPGLFFNGAYAVAANGGAPVPIYSPSPWEEGTSGSHTDDNSYTGAAALLMNAATDVGAGVRTLSAIELAMLRDLGLIAPATDPGPDPEPGAFAYLSNVSVRTFAGTGSQTLTAGFGISGGTKPLLIRGAGPALGPYGVTGFLPNPRVGVFAGTTEQLANEDWPDSISNTAARLGAFPFGDSRRDAALAIGLAAGTYSVQVTDASGATGLALAEVYDSDYPTSASGPRLINVSARAQVGLGNEVLVDGFVVAGAGEKSLLIRGIGATLADYNVPGALLDPRIELFRSENGVSTSIGSNDNWDATTIASVAARVGAFAITAGNSDAAMLVRLRPGSYSVVLSGVANATGIGLIEVYDAD